MTTLSLQNSRSWKNLGFVISFPFAILVISSFIIFGVLAFYSGKQSVLILVDQLTHQANERVRLSLEDYFQTPSIVSKINTDAFAHGNITTKAVFENPEEVFYKQHFQFPSINDIYFSRKDGAIAGIDRLDNKYLLKLTTDEFPNRNFYSLDDHGKRQKVVKSDKYNSLERDWYKKAVAKNAPTWSDIYVLKNKGRLGITFSAPAYNPKGEFEGVVGINLTLNGIAQFLQKIKISENTTTFIIERNGNLVASSTNEKLFKEDSSGKPKRVQAIHSTNPIIQSSVSFVNHYFSGFKTINQPTVLRTVINDNDYIIHVSSYKDQYGLDFVIITVVNELDFIADVHLMIQKVFFLAIGLIIVFIAVGYFISRLITKPIQLLSMESQNIASGNLGKQLSLDSSIYETKMLIDSFNMMSSQLQNSFDALSDLNKTLEQKVLDRTQDLQKANDMLEQSQTILYEAHKNIRDSISYGSLIQHTILPNQDHFKSYFQDSMVIWKPKDTVGGDIYLFEEISEHECLLMIIDCTGHGVPGAFVTMLVKAIERQILGHILSHKNDEVSPAEILAVFNRSMKHLLNQETEDSISNAGFDGGVIYYNKQTNILKYAGAETPLFYTRDGELTVIKGDRCSVGYKKSDANYQFKEHVFKVESGMQFYLTTDGYLDQNGGTKDFPFGTKKFKSLIQENMNNPMESQQNVFWNALELYKGEEQEQNDDITIVAVKI